MLLKKFFWLFLGVLIVGCASQSQSQQRSEESRTLQVSQEKSKPTNGEKYSLPIYQVDWRLCGPKNLGPRKSDWAIGSSDKNGCLGDTVFVWGGKKIGDSYTPKVLLIKGAADNNIGISLPYWAVVLSNGCYPPNSSPQEEGYYNANRTLMLNQKFAAKRRLIEASVDAKLVTKEQLPYAVALYSGEACEKVNVNKKIGLTH